MGVAGAVVARDRIDAGGSPRVAAQNPPKSQPASANGAMLTQGLAGILGATGIKPARPRQHWRDQQLIGPDQRAQSGRQGSVQCVNHASVCLSSSVSTSSFLNAVCKSPTSASKGRFSVAARPIITKSNSSPTHGSRTWLATSRNRRRARLRWTALPTLRLTVKPTRRPEDSLPSDPSDLCRRA